MPCARPPHRTVSPTVFPQVFHHLSSCLDTWRTLSYRWVDRSRHELCSNHVQNMPALRVIPAPAPARAMRLMLTRAGNASEHHHAPDALALAIKARDRSDQSSQKTMHIELPSSLFSWWRSGSISRRERSCRIDRNTHPHCHGRQSSLAPIALRSSISAGVEPRGDPPETRQLTRHTHCRVDCS
jgi:hypothetical protein